MDHMLECAVEETKKRLDNMQRFLENYFDIDMDPFSEYDYQRFYRIHRQCTDLLKLEMDRLGFILKQRAKLDVQE